MTIYILIFQLIFQTRAEPSSAWNRKSVSWTVRGNRPVAAGNNAASNFRRFAEAMGKRIRTSATFDRKPADRDYRSRICTTAPAAPVQKPLTFFLLRM